jgi:hypothetical protein
MPTIKSLEDLKKIREEALQKRQAKVESGSIEISGRNGYSWNSCGCPRDNESNS